MADYYQLIARAVAGLPKNTDEARRALYDRARNALVAQLRGQTPTLSELNITRERDWLEEAIRNVEAEVEIISPDGGGEKPIGKVEAEVRKPKNVALHYGRRLMPVRGVRGLAALVFGFALLITGVGVACLFAVMSSDAAWQSGNHGERAEINTLVIIGLLIVIYAATITIVSFFIARRNFFAAKSIGSPPFWYLLISGIIPGLLLLGGWTLIRSGLSARKL
jgi:hypothetical protein